MKRITQTNSIITDITRKVIYLIIKEKIIKKEKNNQKMNLVVQGNKNKIIIVNTSKIIIKVMELQHFITQNMMNKVVLNHKNMMIMDKENQKRIKMKLDTMIIIIKMITVEEEITKTTNIIIITMIFKIKEDNEKNN